MASLPLMAALLASIAVFLIFMALWLLLQRHDPVDERLNQYGVTSELAQPMAGSGLRQRYPSTLYRFLAGFGLGPRLALTLTRANVPLTATEFLAILLALGATGFAVGMLRAGPLLGLVTGGVSAALPFIVLKIRQRRRLKQFTEQLPDLLTLVVGALRAGYGLAQSLDLVVQRISGPVSEEINKVARAISLGIPIQRALLDASDRVGSDDFHLIVVAINVHAETGGNLAETLEIISDTVRDRLRMLSEIRVLTSQQRFTGYILGAMPIAVGLLVSLINPEYIADLFAPGWVRILPIGAVVLQIGGFLMIRRIVDIEV